MIHGYEGTSFYEDIGKNNPSFLILKHGYKIIRDEALSMFRLLEQIGIAHYDEQESAKIITDVSNDISYWWRDRARQKSLVKFRDKYCRTAMHPEKLLFKFINQNL